VALLSQAKNLSVAWLSRTLEFNVLNKQYIGTNTRNQGVNQLDAKKIGYRMTENNVIEM